MPRFKDIKLLIFFTLLAAASGVARAEIAGYTDSGIPGPPYAAIRAEMGRLAQQHPELATVITYGKTPAGLPLTMVKIEDKAVIARGGNTARKRPVVLITGVTHGNEYLHIEDRLPRFFVEERTRSPGVRRFLDQGGTILIVPIVNPDGYEAHSRDNAHGADLNRDFALLPTREANFREPETRALATRLDQEIGTGKERLALTVDYHCCAGSLLYPWAYSEEELPKAAHEEFMAIAKLMLADIDPHYTTGQTGKILGYMPRGTSKDYYYAKFGALAFTYEGAYQTEARKYLKHTIWWDHVLARVAR